MDTTLQVPPDSPPVEAIAEGDIVVRDGEPDGPRGRVLAVSTATGRAQVSFTGLATIWVKLGRLVRVAGAPEAGDGDGLVKPTEAGAEPRRFAVGDRVEVIGSRYTRAMERAGTPIIGRQGVVTELRPDGWHEIDVMDFRRRSFPSSVLRLVDDAVELTEAGAAVVDACEGEGQTDHRAKRIADARALLDWFATNPGVPVGLNFETYYVDNNEDVPDDAAGIARVQEIAEQFGCEYSMNGDSHHYATKRIGSARYQAIYITQQRMVDHNEVMRRVAEMTETLAAERVAEPSGSGS